MTRDDRYSDRRALRRRGRVTAIGGAPAALLVVVAACSPEAAPKSNEAAAPANMSQPASAAAPISSAPALAIEPEGLRLFDRASGSARAIPFGTGRDAVLAALAFRGDPASSNRLEECGAGPLDQSSWADGLTLYFQDGKLAGWAIGEDGKGTITTAAGIGIGSSRAELEAAYEAQVFESSLGTEFAAGELFGVLDGAGPKAKITNLWAGASCVMR